MVLDGGWSPVPGGQGSGGIVTVAPGTATRVARLVRVSIVVGQALGVGIEGWDAAGAGAGVGVKIRRDIFFLFFFFFLFLAGLWLVSMRMRVVGAGLLEEEKSALLIQLVLKK